MYPATTHPAPPDTHPESACNLHPEQSRSPASPASRRLPAHAPVPARAPPASSFPPAEKSFGSTAPASAQTKSMSDPSNDPPDASTATVRGPRDTPPAHSDPSPAYPRQSVVPRSIADQTLDGCCTSCTGSASVPTDTPRRTDAPPRARTAPRDSPRNTEF